MSYAVPDSGSDSDSVSDYDSNNDPSSNVWMGGVKYPSDTETEEGSCRDEDASSDASPRVDSEPVYLSAAPSLRPRYTVMQREKLGLPPTSPSSSASFMSDCAVVEGDLAGSQDRVSFEVTDGGVGTEDEGDEEGEGQGSVSSVCVDDSPVIGGIAEGEAAKSMAESVKGAMSALHEMRVTNKEMSVKVAEQVRSGIAWCQEHSTVIV